MKTTLAIIIVLALGMGGCIAPVNLTYESARTLAKGQVDVQGNIARYSGTGSSGPLNTNYGFKLGLGVTDLYTLKIRYERLNAPTQRWLFDEPVPSFSVDYFEIENKFRLKGRNTALALPIAYYSMGIISIDPRAYFTFPNKKNTFEFSIIPKIHLFFSKEFRGGSFIPGLSLGMGISSDLDRWALRPEIGWDGVLSIGVGLTMNLSGGKKGE